MRKDDAEDAEEHPGQRDVGAGAGQRRDLAAVVALAVSGIEGSCTGTGAGVRAFESCQAHYDLSWTITVADRTDDSPMPAPIARSGQNLNPQAIYRVRVGSSRRIAIPRRPRRIAVAPRPGASVMLLRTIGSGSGSASSTDRESTTLMTDLIVISARCEPTQWREPAPNGIQTRELGFGSSRNRSGR